MKKMGLWLGALAAGSVLGMLGLGWLDGIMAFVATVYTRLFQLLAVPTIVLAVVTTFASFGSKGSGRVFGRALTYTLLTTACAAAVGAVLYLVVFGGGWRVEGGGRIPSSAESAAGVSSFNPPPSTLHQEPSTLHQEPLSYADHILSVIPDNIVRPFLEGNVLSLLLLAFAVGIGLSRLPESERKTVVVNGLQGLQDLLFLLIRGLIWTLPLGIMAFSAQLSAQLSAGVVADSIGRYVLVVLGGNLIQFFVVLPLFLLARGLNPLRTLGRMMPAVLTAFFTKSSAATLPVTIETAERRLGVRPEIARFVLPICTTINMNGCAAFILVTSLFVMESGGTPITLPTILLWLMIAVVSAVGNAGVPMGCYFLTFSLMSGIGAPVVLLGIILPIYAIIDMVETAENVWSDSCVCAMTAHDLADSHSPENTPRP